MLTSAQHIDVPQPVSDMALTATDNLTDVKPYFDTLPRELRDCVYDLLYQEIEESMGSNVGDLEFHTRAIIPRLRFVSRQFKAEYDERISKNDLIQQLTVTDTVKSLQCPHSKILCSPLSTHTTRLTINMVNDEDCSPAPLIVRATFLNPASGPNWLDNFKRQFPNLREIRLRVCVPTRRSSKTALSLTHRLGVAFPNLTELQVLSWDGITHASTPLGTWSKGGGMQRHGDAIAKHEARQIKIMEIERQEELSE